MASLSNDCNIIAPCCSAAHGNDMKQLKNTTDCHGIKNITVELPEDMMVSIISKLDMVSFHRFSAVCKSWQLNAIAAKKIWQFHLRQPQPPWLILSSSEDHYIEFFNLSQGKVFSLELPELIYGTRCFGSNWGWLISAQCVGSNWGWLIMVGEMGRNFLLNPFARELIELPPQSTLPHVGTLYGHNNCIHKAMLISPTSTATVSSSALTDDCVVIAIYGLQCLAFWTPGEERWRAFHTNYQFRFEDIIFYHRELYAITYEYDLILMELSPHPKGTSCNVPPPAEEDLSLPTMQVRSIHLVECLGELLMVIRYVTVVGYVTPQTGMFKIFKLDQKGRCWIKVEDLGDQMLFIGTSTGYSLSAHNYPGFRGNCIYFTDDGSDARFCGLDAILFHLEDNSIECMGTFSPDCYGSPSIWFTPISS